MSKIIPIVLVIASFACSGYLYVSLNATQGALAAKTCNTEELATKIKALEGELSTMRSQNVLLQAQAKLNNESTGAVTPATVQSQAVASPQTEGILKSRPSMYRLDGSRPDGQRPMSPRRRAMVDAVDWLKLSEADAAKMLAILADEESRLIKLLADTHGDANPNDVDALHKQATQQLTELLGTQKHAEYLDYQHYLTEHQRVGRINMVLENESSPPLTQQQQSQLFAVLKQERDLIPAPNAADFGTRTEFALAYDRWRTELDQRVQARAPSILTTDQLAAFTATAPARATLRASSAN